jgi:hypothetical protein
VGIAILLKEVLERVTVAEVVGPLAARVAAAPATAATAATTTTTAATTTPAIAGSLHSFFFLFQPKQRVARDSLATTAIPQKKKQLARAVVIGVRLK